MLEENYVDVLAGVSDERPADQATETIISSAELKREKGEFVITLNHYSKFIYKETDVQAKIDEGAKFILDSMKALDIFQTYTKAERDEYIKGLLNRNSFDEIDASVQTLKVLVEKQKEGKLDDSVTREEVEKMLLQPRKKDNGKEGRPIRQALTDPIIIKMKEKEKRWDRVDVRDAKGGNLELVKNNLLEKGSNSLNDSTLNDIKIILAIDKLAINTTLDSTYLSEKLKEKYNPKQNYIYVESCQLAQDVFTEVGGYEINCVDEAINYWHGQFFINSYSDDRYIYLDNLWTIAKVVKDKDKKAVGYILALSKIFDFDKNNFVFASSCPLDKLKTREAIKLFIYLQVQYSYKRAGKFITKFSVSKKDLWQTIRCISKRTKKEQQTLIDNAIKQNIDTGIISNCNEEGGKKYTFRYADDWYKK